MWIHQAVHSDYPRQQKEPLSLEWFFYYTRGVYNVTQAGIVSAIFGNPNPANLLRRGSLTIANSDNQNISPGEVNFTLLSSRESMVKTWPWGQRCKQGGELSTILIQSYTQSLIAFWWFWYLIILFIPAPWLQSLAIKLIQRHNILGPTSSCVALQKSVNFSFLTIFNWAKEKRMKVWRELFNN